MAENNSNLTSEWYSFPQNTQVVDKYLKKRAELNDSSTDFSNLTDLALPIGAFTFGTYFAIECITPMGSAARMIKE